MPENITSNGGGTDSYNLDNRVIQVTNVAPQATKEQMQTLFGMIGKLEDLRLYPTLRELASPSQLRICFVKYSDPKDVPVALHLSNTVFIDRALNVSIYCSNDLPDELKGAEILSSVNSFGIVESKLPATLTNQIEGNPPNQVIRTLDPRLSIHNLPNYPLLPASTDSRRLEEIRRTVVAINLDSKVQAKEVMDFFASAGEIKYFRFCSKHNDETRYAIIEFVEQESIVPALKLNNKLLGENLIKVHHSTQSIIKPVQQLNKTNEAAQKEIEDAVNRVKEAQQSILTTVAGPAEEIVCTLEKEKPVIEKEKPKPESRRSRSRSRSRSKSRRRSTSRSRRRRSRSRSRERRKRSRSRSRRRTRSPSRSRSRDRRKRSRSRDRKRSRSRDRRRRSRSRSRSRKRSPRPSRDRRERSKDRSKDTKESDKRSRDEKRDKKDKTRDRVKEETSKEQERANREKESKEKDGKSEKDRKEADRKKESKDKEKSKEERNREKESKDKRRSREKEEKSRDRDRKEKKKDKKEKKPKSPAKEEDSSDEKDTSERRSERRSTPPSPPPPSKSKSRRRSRSGSRGRSR